MADDELKNLPPEDRIKRLKELEKKRQKEIDEAREQIRTSQDELTERRKWVDKVPIPQMIQEDDAGLGEDARQMLKTHHGLREKIKEPELPESAKQPSLEEAVQEAARMEIPPAVLNSDYAQRLSQVPMKELYGQISVLNEAVLERGYATPEEQRMAQYIASAVEQKKESGYEFTEDAARAASLSQNLQAQIHTMYSAGKHKERSFGTEYRV